jgi:hypothetical protein
MPFSNYSNTKFLSGNVSYDLDYLSKHGTCQPSGTYQWGFSFLLLFIFLVALFIWTIGIYVFWTWAHFSLRVHEIPEVPGEYKAIVELAAAMEREFDKGGQGTSSLSEHQIAQKIRRDLNGGRMTHDGSATPQYKHRFPVALKRWLWREKWWLLSFAILTAVWNGARLADMHQNLFFFTLCLTTSIGVLAAMSIGRKAGSRVLIVLFFVMLATMGVFPLLYCTTTNYTTTYG